MSAQRIRFVLFSLGLHFLPVSWLLWQGMTFEHNAIRQAGVPDDARPVMPAKLLSITTQERENPGQILAQDVFVTDQKSTHAGTLISPSSQTGKSAGSDSGSISSDKLNPFSELNPETMAVQDYHPIGRLTRLPSPLTDIDLNAPSIARMEVTGTIILTVLIDASGLVVDVIASAETDDLRTLSDRVAERFKDSRFSPGEINGKAVRSQLQITVVSEALPALER